MSNTQTLLRRDTVMYPPYLFQEDTQNFLTHYILNLKAHIVR